MKHYDNMILTLTSAGGGTVYVRVDTMSCFHAQHSGTRIFFIGEQGDYIDVNETPEAVIRQLTAEPV